MKKLNAFLILLTAVLLLPLSSCYKDDSYSTDDYDLTVTYYDKTFNFQIYGTFYLRDSVALISDYIEKNDDSWTKFYGPNGASSQMREEVRKQYVAMGYNEANSIQDCDFAVNLVATLNKQTDYYYYPGYWWGYPGYWYGYGGYYGGYYPYYPYYGYTSVTYQTGTLMIEMADGKSVNDFIDYMETHPIDPEDTNVPEIKFVWHAFVSGLVGYTDDVSRVKKGINEAFVNSPYLKKQ